MSKKGKKNYQLQNAARNNQTISRPPRQIIANIPTPIPVLLKENAEDEQRYTEEKASRADQLRVSKRLNTITILGAMVGIISLFLLYGTIVRSRKSTEIAERAWVNIQDIKFFPENAKPGDEIQVKITINNTGKSPAYDVFVMGGNQVIHKGKLPTLDKSHGSPMGVLFPQGAFSTISYLFADPATKMPRGVTEDELAGIGNGNRIVVVYGKITYTDAFSHDHWHEFCFSALPNLANVQACDGHNDADHPYSQSILELW